MTLWIGHVTCGRLISDPFLSLFHPGVGYSNPAESRHPLTATLCSGGLTLSRMKVSGSLLHVILLICCMHRVVENTEETPKTTARKPGGTAYIQVVPLNEEASELPLIRQLLTGEQFRYTDSTTEITGIAATTECTKRERKMQCECQPGFTFDMEQCKSHPSCYIPLEVESYCFCPDLNANNTVYCEELPPRAPGKITVSPKPVVSGSDVLLEFSSVGNVTNIRWYLVDVLSNTTMRFRNGSRATVVTSSRKSTLSIKNIPRLWAGLYICRFLYQNAKLQVSYLVEFPLRSSDIVPHTPNVFLWKNSTIPPGFTVECCTRNDGGTYYVFWEPGHMASDAVYRGDWRCYPLTIEVIPAEDTDYRCIFRDDLNTVVESRVRVAFIQDSDMFCSGDRDDRWKVTKAGYNAEIFCASGKIGRISRSCLMTGQWATTQESCVDSQLQRLHEQVEMVEGGLGIPEVLIPMMMESLRNYSSLSLNYISSPSDIITVVETIKMLSVTADANNISLYVATMKDLVTVWSWLLSFDLETFWIPALVREPSLGSTLLQSVETTSRLFKTRSNNTVFRVLNVEMSTVVLTPLTWTGYYIFNTIQNISVIVKNIAMRDSSHVIMIHVVLRNLGKILPLNFGESVKGYDHSVQSHVIVSTIKTGNQTMTQADLDVIFVRGMEPNNTDVGTAQCVFWDSSLLEGPGGWSTEGCETLLVNDSVVCHYRQVAAYSVLMSVGIFEKDVLEIISQVGASLSILSLLICLIVYIVEWKFVVKDDISFYRQLVLINISLSMCIADIWFLVSTLITESHTNKLCIVAAFFQHVFYLASLFWMLLQGFILLYELVFTFQLIKIVVLLAMAWFGYISPLIIASVTIGIDYPKGGYIPEGTCFLDQEDGALFAFSGPVLLVVVLNKFTIVAMVWKLLRPPANEEPEEVEDGKALVSKALAILTSVFGITWILQTMTMLEEVHEAFDYILTILETYQGVIILIFGCLLDKRIREALYKRFQKLQALFPMPACCERASYNMDATNEPVIAEIYRQIPTGTWRHHPPQVQ